MNKVLLFLFITIPFLSFGQEDLDKVMFSYINQYRSYNHREWLSWSDEQYNLSTYQSNNMISNDSLYHNKYLKNSSECVAYGKYSINVKDTGFVNFFKKVCDRNIDVESNEVIYMFILYKFSKSPYHSKTILDSKYKVGSVKFQIINKEINGDKLVVRISCCINVWYK
jgi:uncharacterized protein YkwD